ncbi:MAG TPA: pyridoxal phosphate-dependent aminotransferase [Deltaproteobacteria bacterium]|nr:pyridoxal phosphate-dependent aminotransferase [Deltaproteobacteria bacterium]
MQLNRIEQTYRRLQFEGRPIDILWSGNPNEQGLHFPSEILTELYRRYFEKPYYRPHPKGLPEARRAVAEYYAAQGAPIDSENIVLCSGTSEAFFYLFRQLAETGDNFLAPNPAYPLFDSIAELARVELRHYPLRENRGWSLDLEALQALADFRTRGILLISPNNPTGAVADAEEISRLAHWANSRNLPLICDEVFSEFYFGAGTFPRPLALAKPELCFTLNGISKMFALPALKLAWIAVSGNDSKVATAVDRLETSADTFLSCHTPIQEALPQLFAAGRDFLRNYRETVRQRKELAVERLRAEATLGFTEPQGGFYLIFEILESLPCSEEDFIIGLMEKTGVFLHPGYFFDYERGIHGVLSFLTAADILQSGIDRLRHFIHSF